MRIVLRRSHALDRDELRRRTDARVAHYASRYPHLHLERHYQWITPYEARGTYRGANGRVTLGADAIEVEVELPVFARLFRARIESFVHGEIDLVLMQGTFD